MEVNGWQVGEEAVILRLESGSHCGLDPEAVRGWPLLIEGNSLAAIGGAMLEASEAGQWNREGAFWISRAG